MGGASTGKRSHLAQFDKKVSEADIYLQLIIDQTTKLEEKISSLEDTEEREKYKALQEHTNVSQLCFISLVMLKKILSIQKPYSKCLKTSSTQLYSCK